MSDDPAPHTVDASETRPDDLTDVLTDLDLFNLEAQALKGRSHQLADACRQLIAIRASLGAVLQAYDAGRTRR